MSNTITLPGGITLTLPVNLLQGTLPATTAGTADPLAALEPALGQLATTATGNPLAGIAVGALFAIGHAIHMQLASQPAGSNPSLDAVGQQFWSLVTKAFPLPTTTPAAG